MLKKLLKNKTVHTLFFILLIAFIANFILNYVFKVNENFDIYESDLAPSQFPSSLLLEDTYNVNKSLTTKNMPKDYLYIQRNVNSKDHKTPDNGLCSPMEVCGLYVNKK